MCVWAGVCGCEQYMFDHVCVGVKSLCFVCEPKGLCVSVWGVAGEQCVCVCVCVCV